MGDPAGSDGLNRGSAANKHSWPLDAYVHVGFGRQQLNFELLDGLKITNGKFMANDDQVAPPVPCLLLPLYVA